MDHQTAQRQAETRPQPVTKAAAIAGPHDTRLTNMRAALDAAPVVQRLLAITPPPLHTVANRTGLPDRLKAGIEALSGIAMDHVRVHRNSPKPAQLQAHAYAQGSEIHLAPGQDRHLPHEAWHVVQQAQGRVKPTMQSKGGTAINDDAALERESDVMGRAAQATSPKPAEPRANTSIRPGTVAQRTINAAAALPPATVPMAPALVAAGPVVAPAVAPVVAPVDTVADRVRRFLADATMTNSGQTVAREIETALWEIDPNAGEEARVDNWRRELYRFKARIDAIAGNDAAAEAEATELVGEITKYTNLICNAGAVNAILSWKVNAVRTVGNPVRVEYHGVAIAALVALNPRGTDPRPVPKKPKVSLDRHLWNNLGPGIVSNALNTMLVSTVEARDVQADMALIGERYRALMNANKTADFQFSPVPSRQYQIEHLTQQEPHIFPIGGSDTVTLSQPEHAALKLIKGAIGGAHPDWATLVTNIAADQRRNVLAKMAAMKMSQAHRNSFEAAMLALEPAPPAKAKSAASAPKKGANKKLKK
ncbi:DUF4157 domain-containing protein [Novosphingobium sp. FSW06-99]|uniref:eCIS core domain-containing protein n=1 Tax=Novosphingobium sp. FSW06-99 TaxID=1739113 RepID=UPI000ACF7DC4|nr:DUF4157 domain-containing protein [Novosphingobium sp. FSW06-99]